MTSASVTVSPLAVLVGAAAFLLCAAPPASTQENCVLDSTEVQAAAAAHRIDPGLEPSDEVGRLLLYERTLTRQPVTNDRIEIIKRLVGYAWSHEGQDKNPTLRDFDVSMQFQRDCESGNW